MIDDDDDVVDDVDVTERDSKLHTRFWAMDCSQEEIENGRVHGKAGCPAIIQTPSVSVSSWCCILMRSKANVWMSRLQRQPPIPVSHTEPPVSSCVVVETINHGRISSQGSIKLL
jgi:hypothetical protein